jgi:long-chain acyl-CoA synthetase
MVVMSNFYPRIKEVQPKTKLKTVIVTNLKEQLPPVKALLFSLLGMEKKGGHKVEIGAGDVWLTDLLKKYTPEQRQKVEIGGEDVALFQYSGGTTGLSKAAVATHNNLVANTLQIRAWIHILRPGQEVTLMAIPLFHVYGMVAGMMLSLAGGATLVMVPNPRDLKDVLDNINQYRPTLFPGVPAMYNAINNHPDVKAGKYNLGSIRACISGSAPLMLETKQTFEKLTGGKLFEGYGLSEAPTATHCNPFEGQNKEGSIGMPLPDVECRIVSLEDGKTVLEAGQVGELAVRSPQVFKGYWNMPTETANSLQADAAGGGPWLFTGDIARMDDEGYFYIVDRKKELIKVGGLQVWPREIEEVLASHPKVQEVGVAGIPDARRGEVAKAWVVLKAGEKATQDELVQWCSDKLAKFKLPTEIEFRGELPKTTVGKVLRRELVREHKERAG